LIGFVRRFSAQRLNSVEAPKAAAMVERRVGADEPGLRAYVKAVASAAPTPGGGSVAAVVGALAAALGEMVVNLTVGRPAAAGAEEVLDQALERLGETRRSLLDLAVEDERAYGGYLVAASLPRFTPAEKAARTEAMQAALGSSADVPERVAGACLRLMPVLETIAQIGNKPVLSDAVVAAILAEAAVRAAIVNVRVNAHLIRDPDLSAALLARAADAEASARTGAARVSAYTAERRR
jgi:formiminotetrahydrofolate cyclodeaminase